MHEDSMKNLQGDCVPWLVFFTGAAQLLLVCGEGMLTTTYSYCHVACIYAQECTYLWDQPTSPLTTLRSPSLILEWVVCLLSSVTLTSTSAV